MGVHQPIAGVTESWPFEFRGWAIDRAAPSNVYCCTYYGHVYASNDGGSSWTKNQAPGEMSRSRHVYPMVCG